MPLEALSIDLGVGVLVATSEGIFHPNPRHRRQLDRPLPGHNAFAQVIAQRPLNINDVLDDHVSRETDGVERMLPNAYAPNLQVGGQVATFLTEHLGLPIPSPALLEKIGNRFRPEVKPFAAEHRVPILTLKKPDRTRWDNRKPRRCRQTASVGF